jgi:Protein of unknown function (DUF3017)
MIATATRTRQGFVANLAFELVLVVLAAGFCIAMFSPSHWLRAVVVVAASMLLAGVLRLVLSRNQAGLLRIRGRFFDVACYLIGGGLVLGFGVLVPR